MNFLTLIPFSFNNILPKVLGSVHVRIHALFDIIRCLFPWHFLLEGHIPFDVARWTKAGVAYRKMLFRRLFWLIGVRSYLLVIRQRLQLIFQLFSTGTQHIRIELIWLPSSRWLTASIKMVDVLIQNLVLPPNLFSESFILVATLEP